MTRRELEQHTHYVPEWVIHTQPPNKPPEHRPLYGAQTPRATEAEERRRVAANKLVDVRRHLLAAGDAVPYETKLGGNLNERITELLEDIRDLDSEVCRMLKDLTGLQPNSP